VIRGARISIPGIVAIRMEGGVDVLLIRNIVTIEAMPTICSALPFLEANLAATSKTGLLLARVGRRGATATSTSSKATTATPSWRAAAASRGAIAIILATIVGTLGCRINRGK
jgi:hypothetical protein